MDRKWSAPPVDATVYQALPDLRVAHKSIAKTDGETVRVESAVAVVLGNLVHVSGVGSTDGIALHALLWGDTPAIVYTVFRARRGSVDASPHRPDGALRT